MGLLGAIPRRPGRLNVVLDALERKALRLLDDVNDGHPIGSTVVTCISQHRLPEPAFLIRVGAFEHDAEQASYRCGHHRSLSAAPHNRNGRAGNRMRGSLSVAKASTPLPRGRTGFSTSVIGVSGGWAGTGRTGAHTSAEASVLGASHHRQVARVIWL